MNKLAHCPECGGEVRFTHQASVLAVCSYCQSVLARQGVDVSKIGKVGEVADVPSPLRLHLRGTAYGGFTVVGLLQLDHGAGTWNEWYLGLDGGKWLWLAEAQGRYYLTAPTGVVSGAPVFDYALLGQRVTLPAPGDGGHSHGAPAGSAPIDGVPMSVVEIHQAKVVSARGELPWRIDPGEPVCYIDLSGAAGAFGTLDYGANDDEQPQGYVGREVHLHELGLDPGSAAPDPQMPTAQAARMECPSCHGALELRAPDRALRVTCPYCRALVDVTRRPLHALTTLAPLTPLLQPTLPLGKRATLRGAEYTVLGHLRRAIVKQDFTWDEYVLWGGPALGYRYLLQAQGHFTLVRPVSYGDLRLKDQGPLTFEGHSYQFVETCTTCVTHVNGEFPWAVDAGELVKVMDYAAPLRGSLVSIEEGLEDHKELLASAGEYLEPAEVWRAFGLAGSPPPRPWIAPHQPNPYLQRLERQRRVLLAAMAALLLCMMGFSMASDPQSRTFDLSTVAGVEPAAEHVFLSDPFQLGRSGQRALEFKMTAPVNNTEIGADVSLINDDTGATFAFGTGVAYYFGTDDEGQAWTEGSREASLTVPEVPAGRYVLRVEPSWTTQRYCSESSDCGFQGVCESSKCQRVCAPADAVDAEGRPAPGAGVSCATGQSCMDSRCVLDAIPYKITLRWGVSRPGWGFLFLLFMLAPPLWTWRQRSRFEKQRIEDQS